MRNHHPVLISISILFILALTNFTSQVTSASQDQNQHNNVDPRIVNRSPSVSIKKRNPAEIIAYTGHGMLFDKEMKQIKLDSPLLHEIQTSIMDDILQAFNGELPKKAASEIKKAQQLLDSEKLNIDESVLLKSGVIHLMLQDAPKALSDKYMWRNNALISRYLDYMDRKAERDPALIRPLRPEILDMLPQQGEVVFSEAEGDTEYMAECRTRGVPIPPPWSEQSSEWEFQGTLTQNLLVPGEFAAVWTYSDLSVRGGCIALPRGSGNTGSAAGIICQSATTGHACFWDNKLRTDPNQRFIGWKGLTLDISQLRDGSDLTENCTRCHKGNNVFLISPDDQTWGKVLRGPLSGPVTGNFTTQVESSTDYQGDHPRYIPITTQPPRPAWVNNFAEGGCAGACHELPPATVVGFANNINLLMPPDCALPSTTDPSGCYTQQPRISMPRTVSFGSVPQKDIRTRVIRISNIGSADLSVSIQASPPPPTGQPLSGFRWLSLSANIRPGQNRNFIVEFSPRAQGSFTGTVSVSSNDSRSPHTVRLRGRGLPKRDDNGGGPIEPF